MTSPLRERDTAAEVHWRELLTRGDSMSRLRDELVAMFYPALAGGAYAARAIDAALALLRATGHGDPEGPWVPVGAGVSSGTAWFGAIGEGDHVELTAVGDVVNVAARLASTAVAGEVVVSAEAATAAGLRPSLPERLALKGRDKPAEIVRLRVAP